MTINTRLTRRRFLDATLASAGGVLLGGGRPLLADATVTPGEASSTDHFWYRLQPDGPYIYSQSDDKAFGFSNDSVMLSEDNGHSWPHRAEFPDAQNVKFSHVFRNGNVLFCTRRKIYLSTDNLKTYCEITLKNRDGTDYVLHTPQNPNQPGWYFLSLTGVNSWEVDDREMLVWGNYCNVDGGATPPNIYYSADNGESVKIAYAFGQNPYHRDNGAPGGGGTGTLLGDSDNPVFCRHIHCVTYNPLEEAFYACTGDHDRAEGYECHWLRGTYNAAQDRWSWEVIVSNRLNSRYKSGGINFVDGQLYFISDANGPKPHDRGIFRCDPADIGNPAAHTMLFDPKYECANMIIQDNVILAGQYAPASPFTAGLMISPDLGKTWAEYDLKELGPRSPLRFQRKNGDGWFRVDMRKGWIDRSDVLFIKPKTI
ncbi:MAG: hypothetical protein ACQESR_27545 [Planctomycetota bacterium]